MAIAASKAAMRRNPLAAWVETVVRFVRMRRGPTLAGLTVLVLGLAATGGYWWYRERLEIEASRALAQAYTAFREATTASPGGQNDAVQRYRQVGQQYRGTRAGEEALLRAGNLEFAAGQVDQALASFGEYLLVYPRGRFRVMAGLGLAYSQEAKGHLPGAAKTLAELVEREKNDPLIAEGYMALGRVYEQQKKPDEAMRIYGQVVERYSQSRWAQQALQRMGALKAK